MDSLSTKDVVGVILGIIVLGTIVFALTNSSPRSPKERFFNCWRCKALTPHTQRTIDAWRIGKTRLFCGACHAKWLQTHPAPITPLRPTSEYRPRRRSSKAGGLVVLAAVVVIGLLARSCS
ncbi:hypothetical protein C8J98_101625 [Luteibacter sp. OK325]|jgi:hypothetical protein|uniref:hypothetical protein n=2 Tax=Rhodanobacteraceae TaxID=1775411 RepID=UPI000D3343CD|nr:hypothetical protein [Luteibacter sp. OK325]PTR35361.1 hypothetical protein C8J98_101625 [Luteibacter sp. OK325]